VLIKRTERQARRGSLAVALQGQSDGGLDRRNFLRKSGLVAGSLATLGALPLASVRKAEAGPPPPAGAQVTIRKNICTHCSVGCTVTAEVANGVWIGQEPSWESPINRGSHCAKGAAVRELVHGDRRLRYPMKLVNGQWTKLSWEQAIDEIGDKLMAIRKVGPDRLRARFAKLSKPKAPSQPLAGRPLGDQPDHRARICHRPRSGAANNSYGA
jgi:formate dehydrogenase major subunit